jgi:hypothetical protein
MQSRHLDMCNTPILSGTTVYQVDSPEARFCDQTFPFRADFKLLGSTRLPWDMQVSATFQVASGPNVTASNQFLRPTNVLQGRLFKVNAQIDF